MTWKNSTISKFIPKSILLFFVKDEFFVKMTYMKIYKLWKATFPKSSFDSNTIGISSQFWVLINFFIKNDCCFSSQSDSHSYMKKFA